VLGVILFVGGALLLTTSGVYNEYGQLLLFYDSYWSCVDCESPNLAPFAALGIMTTVAGMFLIAINHRYLSRCIRRVQALA
jgi:drug/metabolite transporter (DMT)-like permease